MTATANFQGVMAVGLGALALAFFVAAARSTDPLKAKNLRLAAMLFLFAGTLFTVIAAGIL